MSNLDDDLYEPSMGAVPDALLPSQFADMQRNAESPVKRLMLAILTSAIRDSYSRRSDIRLAELAWIRAHEPDRLFSFEQICGVLGLPSRALRERLLSEQRVSVKRGTAVQREKAISMRRSRHRRH